MHFVDGKCNIILYRKAVKVVFSGDSLSYFIDQNLQLKRYSCKFLTIF